MPGKYGPYVKWEKVNATLPKGVEPEAVTLEEALVLIAEKAGKSGTKKKAAPKKAAAKPAAKKAAPKKTAVKKAPAKKTAAAE
jgi:DNA topoisomerase-1